VRKACQNATYRTRLGPARTCILPTRLFPSVATSVLSLGRGPRLRLTLLPRPDVDINILGVRRGDAGFSLDDAEAELDERRLRPGVGETGGVDAVGLLLEMLAGRVGEEGGEVRNGAWSL
jgi:hypothetical protein